jgi:agmatinase
MSEPNTPGRAPVKGPADALQIPRFAGISTYARLPLLDDVGECDVAVLGVPFDSGVTYRPGARFGPSAIRAASRLLRPFDPHMGTYPFRERQVADAGDVACTPFSVDRAIGEIERGVRSILERARHPFVLGGDHTVALPVLRCVRDLAGGPVALVHFDAHLDTWDTYFGADYTHGTPFRRASEEGLIQKGRSVHVGIRGSLYDSADLDDDESLGFRIVSGPKVARTGAVETAEVVKWVVGDEPVYVSIDVDVLDPAFAPGTGTPEPGGLLSRELREIIRGLNGINLIGADVVEVSPQFDHAEITSLVAANLCYDLLSLLDGTDKPPGYDH